MTLSPKCNEVVYLYYHSIEFFQHPYGREVFKNSADGFLTRSHTLRREWFQAEPDWFNHMKEIAELTKMWNNPRVPQYIPQEAQDLLSTKC